MLKLNWRYQYKFFEIYALCFYEKLPCPALTTEMALQQCYLPTHMGSPEMVSSTSLQREPGRDMLAWSIMCLCVCVCVPESKKKLNTKTITNN